MKEVISMAKSKTVELKNAPTFENTRNTTPESFSVVLNLGKECILELMVVPAGKYVKVRMIDTVNGTSFSGDVTLL